MPTPYLGVDIVLKAAMINKSNHRGLTFGFTMEFSSKSSFVLLRFKSFDIQFRLVDLALDRHRRLFEEKESSAILVE